MFWLILIAGILGLVGGYYVHMGVISESMLNVMLIICCPLLVALWHKMKK